MANAGPAGSESLEQPQPPGGSGRPPSVPAQGWLARRRARVAEELARNRRGGHRVPTWLLTLILIGFVAAWVSVIAFA